MTVIHETLWYLIIKFFKVVLQFKCHWTALYRLKSNTQHVPYSYAHVRSRVQVLTATFPSPNQDAARRTHFRFRKRRASLSEGPHLAVHTYISLSLSPCANGTSKNPSFTASRARTRACTPRARTHRDKEAQHIPCKQKFIFAAAKFNDQHVWPTVCCMRPPVAKPPPDFLAGRSIPSLSLYSHSRFIRARRDIYGWRLCARLHTHTHTHTYRTSGNSKRRVAPSSLSAYLHTRALPKHLLKLPRVAKFARPSCGRRVRVYSVCVYFLPSYKARARDRFCKEVAFVKVGRLYRLVQACWSLIIISYTSRICSSYWFTCNHGKTLLHQIQSYFYSVSII